MINEQTEFNNNSLPIPPLLTLPPPTISPYTHFCTEKQLDHFNLVNGDLSIDLDEKMRVELESKLSQNLKSESNYFTHDDPLNEEEEKFVNITQYIKCQKCEKWFLNSELDLHMSFHPSQITERLFLGDRFGSANKKELFERLEITHIVNAATELPNCFEDTEKISYLKLELEDKMHEDVIQPCLVAAEFIYNSLSTKEENKVFVHCAMGKSRSVAAIIVYLMKYQKMGFKESLEFVKSKRSISKPNPNYLRQLQEFETILKNSTEHEMA